MTSTEVPVPRPAALNQFVQFLISRPWPRSDAEQTVFFKELGFEDVVSDERDDNEISRGGSMLIPAIASATAFWTAFKHELLGVNVFIYDSPGMGPRATKDAYGVLRVHFTDKFGSPTVDDPDTGSSLATVWAAEGFLLEMYYSSHRARSFVQVGISHADRSAIYEAAVEASVESSWT